MNSSSAGPSGGSSSSSSSSYSSGGSGGSNAVGSSSNSGGSSGNNAAGSSNGLSVASNSMTISGSGSTPTANAAGAATAGGVTGNAGVGGVGGSGSGTNSVTTAQNAPSTSSSASSNSVTVTTKRRGGPLLNSSSGVLPTCTSQVPVTADLASLFECPVCFDYVLPPILQCQSGHLVCSNCRPKLTVCPTCRGPLGNIRNLGMEKVASTIMFPCKYSASGCSMSLLHSEKVEHEELCEWRPYTCPCPGASCKWQGGLEQVMAHLMMSHKSITTLQGEDIVFLATDINLPGAVDWVMMQSCFGHNFMLVLEKQEKFDGHQQFFAIVQLIGSRKQAENFAYRLELNGHRRRLTWEATPRSIHEGVSTAIMNSDCLVFDTSIAQLFSDNGNLGINVTISMV